MKRKLFIAVIATAICAAMPACNSSVANLSDEDKAALKEAASSAVEKVVEKVKEEASKE